MDIQLGNDNVLLYMQIYNYYKKLITDGQLSPGSKLPSIRRTSAELSVSRTTAETAYMMLAADGYIIAKAQSGFYVNELDFIKRPPGSGYTEKKSEQSEIRYDFLSAKADMKSFDFNLWRRYIKSALRQDERLLSYGEPQGEYELRSALAKYISEKRNVVCNADSIIVGAGVQSLLHIICALWEGEKRISFPNNSFSQGMAIFNDYGWDIDFQNNKSAVIYATPSHISKSGGVMNVKKRLALIKEASENGGLIIEDDYDSEFSYFSRPAPSMQSLAGGHGVVYISTFSRLLLPSIRISFMVLPPELLEKYHKLSDRYNQTASKTEQIALCQFIRDGHLASQTRKLRRLYSAKSKKLAESIKTAFGEHAKVMQNESGLNIRVTFFTQKTAEEINNLCHKKGIAISVSEDKTAVLSCTSVDEDSMDIAAKELYDAVMNIYTPKGRF